MSSQPVKKPLTQDEQWNRDRARIHALKTKVKKAQPCFGDDNYRDLIGDVSRGRCDSSKELTPAERRSLIERLQALAGEEASQPKPKKPTWSKKNYPNRPKNMDKAGESRSDQLGKIEALLTVGKLSWKYADAIATQMRLADKVQWVKTEDLFRIITALTKKAQKEGWDLSGAK